MALDVGIAQAIVRRPSGNPPADKTVLWFEQTNPVQPELGVLRWYNSNNSAWEQLYQDNKTVFFREVFTVSTDGETAFVLTKHASLPEMSRLHVHTLGELVYGEDYTLTGPDLVFLPKTAGGENWVLRAGDLITITYFF